MMKRHEKSCPALIVPSPALIVPSPALIELSLALIVPLPANRVPNKQAPKVRNNIPRNPSFCSFALFLIFW